MTPKMSADEVKAILGLEPHPREGGFFVQTYRSEDVIRSEALPHGRFVGRRHVATAIYYLLEPGTFSEMHRLASDEVFHFYAGNAVEMLQLHPGGVGSTMLLGIDLLRGERPQALVPHGVWQGSRLVPGGAWALLGCTVSPGFEYEDYETGSRAELCAQWPEFSLAIADLTHG